MVTWTELFLFCTFVIGVVSLCKKMCIRDRGVVVMVLALALVWALAPVADSHKPLSGRERVVYAKRARGIALAELAAALVAWAAGWRVLFAGVCTMFVVMAVMLVLGWLRNGLLGREGLA